MRKKIEMLLMSGALVLALPITVSASAGMPEVQAADLETPQSEVLEQPILEKINREYLFGLFRWDSLYRVVSNGRGKMYF